MKLFFSPLEAKTLWRMGLPIFLAQLSQVAMNFVDTVMAGRYSAADLAGVAVGGSVWGPCSMFAIGCLHVLSGMSSQLVGAKRPDRAAWLLRQGLLLSCAISSVLILLLWYLSCHLSMFGLEGDMERVSKGYLQALLPGLPGFLFFINIRSFFEGFGLTRPAMVIGLFCLLLNIPCNYIFIYGCFGLPEMGGIGCGIATSICFWFMTIFIVVLLHFHKDLGRYSLFRRQPVPASPDGPDGHDGSDGSGGDARPLIDIRLIGNILRIGLPNAVAICIEVSAFAMTAILLAPLGSDIVAGHQIALNFSALIFAIPLSISMAATIRVGYNLGAGKRTQAVVSAHTAVASAVGIALCTMALTILFRERIVLLYTDAAQVVPLACELMLFCAAYQVVDSLQSVTVGALRGYNDTRIISLVCLFSYGVLGLGGGIVLGRTDWIVPCMGASGFWTGYILCLSFCAVVYLSRLHWLHGLDSENIRKRLAK